MQVKLTVCYVIKVLSGSDSIMPHSYADIPGGSISYYSIESVARLQYIAVLVGEAHSSVRIAVLMER